MPKLLTLITHTETDVQHAALNVLLNVMCNAFVDKTIWMASYRFSLTGAHLQLRRSATAADVLIARAESQHQLQHQLEQQQQQQQQQQRKDVMVSGAGAGDESDAVATNQSSDNNNNNSNNNDDDGDNSNLLHTTINNSHKDCTPLSQEQRMEWGRGHPSPLEEVMAALGAATAAAAAAAMWDHLESEAKKWVALAAAALLSFTPLPFAHYKISPHLKQQRSNHRNGSNRTIDCGVNSTSNSEVLLDNRCKHGHLYQRRIEWLWESNEWHSSLAWSPCWGPVIENKWKWLLKCSWGSAVTIIALLGMCCVVCLLSCDCKIVSLFVIVKVFF